MVGCKYVVHSLRGVPVQTKIVGTNLRPLSTAVERENWDLLSLFIICLFAEIHL